jgi:membrane protein YdbS with pleckstrin-like domain
MALVTCPECRGAVSTAATSCPHCGRPMTAAAAGLVAPAGDGAEERELWQGTPSAKAMLRTIVTAGLFSLGLPLVAYLGYRPTLRLLSGVSPDVARPLASHAPEVRLAVLIAVLALVVARLGRLAWRLAVLKSHRYRVTNQRMVIESGVLSRRIDELDMRTVEDLEFQQSVVERLLGIGDITVVSSDRNNARTRLVGVARPRELRELIRSTVYQATHRQLFTRQT